MTDALADPIEPFVARWQGVTQVGLGGSVQRNVQPQWKNGAPSRPAPPAPWPQSLPEQMAALANALTTQPQSETELAARFAGKGKWKARLPELLATLATLGRARRLDDGRWMG